ncbi:MAG TPA: dockerin type I repeat-containing protein [Tepidisphaeraceae bacterium]
MLAAAIGMGAATPLWAVQDNWLPTGAGNFLWSTAANWSPGVPNNFITTAFIDNNPAGSQTIEEEGQTVATLVIGSETSQNEPFLLEDPDVDAPLNLLSKFGTSDIFINSSPASNNSINTPEIDCDLNVNGQTLFIQSYSQSISPDPSNPNSDFLQIVGNIGSVNNIEVNHANVLIGGFVDNSGSVTLDGGYSVLYLNSGSQFGTAPTITMADSTDALDIESGSQIVGAVNGSGTIFFSQSALQLTGSSTFSGSLVSFFSGTLDVQSGGSFTFAPSSASPGFYGTLEADSGGNLAASTSAALGQSSIVLVGGTFEAQGSFQSNATIALFSSGAINTDSGVTLTQSGAISGSGAILVKNGGGTLVMDNVHNSFSQLNVNAGTVATGPEANQAAGTPLGTGAVVLAGGNLALQAGSISQPLAVTGFNQDVVVERGASDFDAAVSAAFDAANKSDGFAFYESGYLGHTTGLPQNHSFVSATNEAVSFTLGSYSANNVLLLSSTEEGSLQLAQPGVFNTISFLAAAANGDADALISLNFSDGSHDAGFDEVVPDWFDDEPGAISANGRLSLFTGGFDNEGSGFPLLYEFDLTIPAADAGKTLDSIDFSDASGGSLGIFALSGNASVPGSSQTYNNDITVAADSTISVTGAPTAQLNSLTIGSNTLFVTGNPNSQLSFQGAILNGNATFDVAPNTQLNLDVAVIGSGGITKNDTGVLLVVDPLYSGPTTVNAGKMIVDGNLINNAVTIAGAGTLQIGMNSGLQILSSLSIAPGGVLDLENNHLILSYAPGTQAAVDSTIRGYLVSGYAGGEWIAASGIDSSIAAVTIGFALGYADGADGVVAGLSSGQIEVKYTRYGDANLDGVVNGVDFTILVGNLNKSGKTWDQGDFNYDGVVSGVDFTLLIENLGKSATGASITLPAADLAAIDAFAAANGLMADVPEPASAGLTVLGVLGMLGRRGRRCVGR